MEQPADFESWHFAGMVHSRLARMGLEFHGRNCFDSHGAGFSFWSLQVSTRADLDGGRVSAANDAGHGFYRTGVAIRSGRVLGIRNRSLDCKPGSGDWAVGGESHVGRANYRGAYAFKVFRGACFPG